MSLVGKYRFSQSAILATAWLLVHRSCQAVSKTVP